MSVPTIAEARSEPLDPGLLLMAVACTVPDHPAWDSAVDELATQLAGTRGIDHAEARRILEASLPHSRVVMNPPGVWQELLDGGSPPSEPVTDDPGPFYGPDDEPLR